MIAHVYKSTIGIFVHLDNLMRRVVMTQGPIMQRAYGFNGYVLVFPSPIVQTRAPVNGSDGSLNGQLWINTATSTAYAMVNEANSIWVATSSGTGTFANLTVTPGPTAITGLFTVTSGTNAVNIAADAAANTVNVATGAGAKTATFGSTNTTSTTTVQSGSGGGNITSTGLETISSSRANDQAINLTASNAAGGINISAAGGTVVAQYRAAGETHTLTNLPWTLATGTGAINISADGTNTTVDIATGAGSKLSKFGSSSAGSTTTLFAPAGVNGGIINSNGTQTAGWFVGTGVPAFVAPRGSLFINTTATTTTTRMYINADGAATWTNFTTAG